MQEHILTIACENRRGIVASVSGEISAHEGNITEATQFDDRLSGQFFMRVAFELAGPEAAFRAAFEEVASRFAMRWTMRAARQPMNVLILVSKFDHCLQDLLYRKRTGSLAMEVPAIVSNHLALAPLAEQARIPFVHLPVTAATKASAEARLFEVIEDTRAEFVVLARYMQVLSDDACRRLPGRVVNIHHSFLPSFKGAKPYHQAHERGVKMIGATAHYVTGDLDEGPIIAQDVEHVSHADTPDDLVGKGRDIERRVLARAVAWHLEDRVLLNGHKTVVFRK